MEEHLLTIVVIRLLLAAGAGAVVGIKGPTSDGQRDTLPRPGCHRFQSADAAHSLPVQCHYCHTTRSNPDRSHAHGSRHYDRHRLLGSRRHSARGTDHTRANYVSIHMDDRLDRNHDRRGHTVRGPDSSNYHRWHAFGAEACGGQDADIQLLATSSPI